MHLTNLFYDSVLGGGIDLETSDPQTYFVTAEKKSGIYYFIMKLSQRTISSHSLNIVDLLNFKPCLLLEP